MAIKITGTLEPAGKFPLAFAKDVEMPDGTRLSEVTIGGSDPRVDIIVDLVQDAFDSDGKIKEEYLPENIGGTIKTATHIDLTRYDSEGVIVEHYADGSTLTHTLERDGSGNPIKITDSDGKEVTLEW